MGKKKSAKSPATSFTTKKCPYCQAHLPLDAEECTNCKKSIGIVERHGSARKKNRLESLHRLCDCLACLFYLHLVGFPAISSAVFEWVSTAGIFLRLMQQRLGFSMIFN